MRVLVIEDNSDIATNIGDYLEDRGHVVDFAGDGVTGLHLAVVHDFDVIVLDLTLPGMDGLEVARKLRHEAHKQTPILMLTARDALEQKLTGFESGADDYMTKPFSVRELVARVQALLRRTRAVPADATIASGPLRIDPLAREVTLRGRPLTLTPREFDLLAFLATHPGRAISREELLRKVRGYDYVGETRTVDVHIRRLRAKLGEKPRLIETVTGSGYKFVAPVKGAAG